MFEIAISCCTRAIGLMVQGFHLMRDTSSQQRPWMTMESQHNQNIHGHPSSTFFLRLERVGRTFDLNVLLQFSSKSWRLLSSFFLVPNCFQAREMAKRIFTASKTVLEQSHQDFSRFFFLVRGAVPPLEVSRYQTMG